MSDISPAEVEWMEKLQASQRRLEIPAEVLERLRTRGWVAMRGDGSTVMTGAGRESLVRLRYNLPIPETTIDPEPEAAAEPELRSDSEELDLADDLLDESEPTE